MSSGRILKIFLVIAMFSAAILPLPGGIVLRSNYILEQDKFGSGDADFLRAALRRIDRWAKNSKVKSAKVRVHIRCGETRWGFLESGNRQIVFFKGNSDDWKKSFEMRQVIYGILFRARFAQIQPKKPETLPLPVWMTAAVDEAVASRNSNEQYHSGNKNYQALQLIMKKRSALPGFAGLCQFELLPSDPASRQIFHQMSVLLMEIASKNGLLKQMVSDHADKRKPDNWTGLYSSPREAQIALTDLAADFLWNQRTPLPEILLRENLKSLQKITMPELDSTNVPTGKMLVLDFEEAHLLLKKSDRPDSTEIRNYYSRQWNKLASRQSDDIRQICYNIARTVRELGISGDAPENFKQLYSELQRRLAHQSNISRELIRNSFHTLPLTRLYDLDFSNIEISAHAASTGAIDRVMEESEKKYFENY